MLIQFLQQFSFLGDPNLNASAGEDEWHFFERYCREYEEKDDEYIRQFGDKRRACYQHGIQLILLEFTKVQEISNCLNKAKKLVYKVKGNTRY